MRGVVFIPGMRGNGSWVEIALAPGIQVLTL